MSRRIDSLMLLSNACTSDPRVIKEAETLAAAGYRVRVLAWDRSRKNPAFEEGAFEIERMAARSSFGSGLRQLRGFIGFWLWLVRRGLALRPKVLHAHDLDTFPAALVLAVLLRVPLVFDNHELYAEMQVGRMPKLAIRVISMLERFAMRMASVAIVVSHIARDYFSRVRRDTVIVGNWYSPVARDAEAARVVRAELGIPEEAFVVGYIGGLPHARNFGPLIEAAAADERLYALVAGSGDQAEDLRQRAATHGRLKFIGFTEQPDRYFNAVDALYYLYRDDEHYGKYSASNALGRAMSRGIPLLTNDWGENGRVMRRIDPELLLREGTAGEVRRVTALLRNPETAAAVRGSVEALARAECSWEAAGDALRDVYARLVKTETRSR
ncbi:MAG TPA: glycosyltransferase [Thermoanaerobaculia bacterium]|nr:glycosyltransferase [Thermoanaerobaculia bacterium]